MFSRAPLLAFLTGGFLLLLGGILLVSADTSTPSTLERGENRQRPEDEDPQQALLLGSILIVLGLVFAVPPVLRWVNDSPFTEAVLEPPAEGIAMGGEAVVRVRLVPSRPLRVASAELHLISEEQAQNIKDGSGYNDEENRLMRVMELHRWSTRLPVPLELNAPLELEVPISLHPELPPTFHWERHMTRTRLELEVVLIGRMNVHLERELLVLPRYAPSRASA